MNKKIVLVTGGLGFIGSHTTIALIENGYEVVIVDNLSNSTVDVLRSIEKVTGVLPSFYNMDVGDSGDMSFLLRKYTFSAVMHFAGLKAVGESTVDPLRYYENNVMGSLVLLREMKRANVKTFVFSSSATVYGDPKELPIKETAVGIPTNPYGQTKLTVETILRDLYKSDPTWSIANLRYFNPVGAHPSGLLGENPIGVPNNLMPYIAQVATGQRDCLTVMGNDYDTKDGTGVRDYIHVMDLAEGHVKALQYCETRNELLTVNLGTGVGYSVLEVLCEFKKASGVKIPFCIAGRRPGDIAACWADTTLAEEKLGWTAKLGLGDMCRDSWRWVNK